MDLRNALNVKKIMIERGSWRENKIGIINAAGDGKGGLIGRNKGDVVIYRPYEGQPGKCTIETPKSREYLEKEGEPGSRILCIGTCVGFPVKYIDEILLDEPAAESVRPYRVCCKCGIELPPPPPGPQNSPPLSCTADECRAESARIRRLISGAG